LTIANNTGVNTATIGRFLYLMDREADQITLVNNLYTAPNLVTGGWQSAAVYVNDTNLGSFKTISNNNWDIRNMSSGTSGGIFYVFSYWSNMEGYKSPSEWAAYSETGTEFFERVTLSANAAPGANSAAARSATAAKGVLFDRYGVRRPATNIAIGAVEI